MDNSIFENIEKEADEFNKKLLELYDTDEVIKKLYRGIRIWYSPIIENPQIMFLGINPGAGYYSNTGKPENDLKPMKKMIYADPEHDFCLKWEWDYVFGEQGLNRRDLLESSVKSNFCYFITESSKDLIAFLKQFEIKLGISPYKLCGNWTNQLVKNIKPKILICEGKDAFDLLKNWSFRNEIKIDEEIQGGYLDDITVLYFKRTYSNLKDKEKIIQTLSNYIK